MTQQDDRAQQQTPASIRSEVFSHRMRGLDEAEVRDYLDQLAGQVETMDAERERQREEIEHLRRENSRLREEAENAANEINPQAVALFSQAQQVADQLVEEAVVHARDLMQSARNQQREILERARAEAEEITLRASAQAAVAPGPIAQPPIAQPSIAEAAVAPASGHPPAYMAPIPEIEYVRTYARVAQVQLRSVLDALAEQVDRLGELPQIEPGGAGHGPGAVHYEPRNFPLPHSQAQPEALDGDPETGSRADVDLPSIYQQMWVEQDRRAE